MTDEDKNSPVQNKPITLSPWLVVLGALVLYGCTLQHWVTWNTLPIVARITGWDWHPLPLAWRPVQTTPLYLLLTLPIRVLPTAWEPLALNIFAALCATLTLGLLAASVRRLPQDRTREQRQRENGEYALLSVKTAFLPPLFAVIIMGLQLTFWRNAICTSVDMLDLLVFAFLIYSLLKYRISQNDNGLLLFAFAYGLGITNDWALIGFFPLFLIALIWIKGVGFFNWRFLGRMAGCGIAGLLLYLLIPLIGSLGQERANFFTLLHLELGAQSFGLRQVPRWLAAVAALPTLLPLVFAGIIWPSFDRELSAAGSAMTKFMFRLLHFVFLALALIMFFDVKISPSQRLDETRVGFLTFYYLGALCIGYFSGYILLVFSKTGQSWERPGPLMKAVNMAIVAALWVLAVAAPIKLIIQNYPHIAAGKNSALEDISSAAVNALPPKTSIILSDDPTQLYLFEAARNRAGKATKNILIDTSSLPHRDYVGYLLGRYPELKKVTKSLDKVPPVVGPEALIGYLYTLRQTNYSLYYLHPSFGYYFEEFYLKPHGVIYEMEIYPKGQLLPPPATPQEIKENTDFWARMEKNPSLTNLPALAKLDPDANSISVLYSVDLNYWGVCLQTANYLKEAHAAFGEAARINPLNFMAKINRDYNEQLQKGDHRAIDTGDLVYRAVHQYHGAEPIMKFNGPCDEPGLDLAFGELMAEGKDLRQAAILFDRRLQLIPNDAVAELDLAKTYIDMRQPDKALTMVTRLHANTNAPPWDVTRVEALAYYSKNDFPTAEHIMENAVKEKAGDPGRLAVLAEFYRGAAYTAVNQKKPEEANRCFKKSLSCIDQELTLLKGNRVSANQFGVPEALLKKAEVEMMLKTYDPSIKTLSQLLEIQPENATGLLNRAIAEIQITNLSGAKDDYITLRKVLPHQQEYLADYGLADVAHREKNGTEEIRWLKRYLGIAPVNGPDYPIVKQRLQKLESP